MGNRTSMGTLLLAGVAFLAAGDVGAQATHRCASIAADEARLACYDAAFGKPAAAGNASSPGDTGTGSASRSNENAALPAAGGAASTSAAASSAAAAKAREDFGLSEVDKRARKPQEEIEPDRITSTLAKVATRPTGELVLTLADGQVWTQVELDSRFRARTGDSVTIRKATLGSYLMVGPDRIATRVRRVK